MECEWFLVVRMGLNGGGERALLLLLRRSLSTRSAFFGFVYATLTHIRISSGR